MATFEDLSDFFNPDDFGVEMHFINAQGESQTCLVTFDETSLDSDLGQVEWEAHQPRITGRYQEVKTLSPNDNIQIENRTYQVAHFPEHDGTGLAQVRLHPLEA